MVTIAHLVEKLIEQKPFLQEALSRGIVNNAALAEELIPQVEKELKKKVKFSAVNMAIRRFGERLSKTLSEKQKFDKTADIIIRSNLVIVDLYRSEGIHKYTKELYELVDFRKGDFLTITEGLHEVMVITNDKYEMKAADIFPEKFVKKKIKNLGSLTIRVPMEAIETPGLFFMLTRALAWENINIIEIVSTLTEMTFIMNEDDIPRAFDTLKKIIKTN